MTYPETLSLINTISNIVVAVSASVAVSTYFYKKEKDNILAVVEQVSFFRERILSEGNKFIFLVRKEDKNYAFSRIKLDEPSIEIINKKYPNEVLTQLDLIKKNGEEFFSLQVSSLNLIEELSLRIKYSKTYNHKAFKSIKPAFVEIVEITALILMQEREVLAGNKIYSATLELYSKWKDDVDRSSPEERTKKILESYDKKN